jgi:hypothetical protein
MASGSRTVRARFICLYLDSKTYDAARKRLLRKLASVESDSEGP